ncbi:MAG: hypothetical protein LUD82_09875, partial [Clostridiales bacterium]|nr:hypothetical protein [Clostridiales bacterium]
PAALPVPYRVRHIAAGNASRYIPPPPVDGLPPKQQQTSTCIGRGLLLFSIKRDAFNENTARSEPDFEDAILKIPSHLDSPEKRFALSRRSS